MPSSNGYIPNDWTSIEGLKVPISMGANVYVIGTASARRSEGGQIHMDLQLTREAGAALVEIISDKIPLGLSLFYQPCISSVTNHDGNSLTITVANLDDILQKQETA